MLPNPTLNSNPPAAISPQSSRKRVLRLVSTLEGASLTRGHLDFLGCEALCLLAVVFDNYFHDSLRDVIECLSCRIEHSDQGTRVFRMPSFLNCGLRARVGHTNQLVKAIDFPEWYPRARGAYLASTDGNPHTACGIRALRLRVRRFVALFLSRSSLVLSGSLRVFAEPSEFISWLVATMVVDSQVCGYTELWRLSSRIARLCACSRYGFCWVPGKWVKAPSCGVSRTGIILLSTTSILEELPIKTPNCSCAL